MILLIIIAFIALILLTGVRIAQEYQRGVVFRLGRYIGLRGPGYVSLCIAKGVFPMPMVVKVRRWGNSLGLRLPKSFTVAHTIVDGTTVRIDGLQVVDAQPRHRSRHKLKDVLQNYTKLPQQLDFPPVGREIL